MSDAPTTLFTWSCCGAARCSAGRWSTPTALGGYYRMVDHHRDLVITPEQRFRFVTLMRRADDDADPPTDPE